MSLPPQNHHVIVPNERFRLLQGEDRLTEYRVGTVQCQQPALWTANGFFLLHACWRLLKPAVQFNTMAARHLFCRCALLP